MVCRILLFLAFFIGCYTQVHAQWKWGKSPTCSQNGYGSEGWLVKADNLGNVYTAGFYWGPRLCVGDSTFRNAASPDATQTLLIKHDSNGHQLWAVASTRGQSRPISICTDEQGNLIVFGFFHSDTMTIGGVTLANPAFVGVTLGNQCIFLAKFSADGRLLWIKTGQSVFNPSGDYLHPGGMALDASGNIYCASTFTKRTYLVPPYTLFNANDTSETNDIFLLKYNPNGQLIWARSYGGYSDEYVSDIAVFGNSSVYMTGYINPPSATFGRNNIFSWVPCGFLVRLDTAGNVAWVNKVNGESKGKRLATDTYGNICVAIGTRNPIEVEDVRLSNANGGNYYVTYSPAGKVVRVVSVKMTNAIGSCCNPHAMVIDACNRLHISLNLKYATRIYLDSTHTVAEPAGALNPICLVSYDDSGKLLHYEVLRSGGGDNTGLDNIALSVDKFNKRYVVGDYQDVDKFIFNADTLTLHDGQISNIFTAQYALPSCLPGEPPIVADTAIVLQVFPIPSKNELNVWYNGNIPTNAMGYFYNAWGQLVYTFYIKPQTVVDISLLPNGIYYLKLDLGSIQYPLIHKVPLLR